jgi:hypothetical protein
MYIAGEGEEEKEEVVWWGRGVFIPFGRQALPQKEGRHCSSKQNLPIVDNKQSFLLRAIYSYSILNSRTKEIDCGTNMRTRGDQTQNR